jgi:PIN domain nuclease of toxin-antitoxin system
LSAGLLLDTCAFLDLGTGLLRTTPARDPVERARRVRQVHVPAIVAFEMAQKSWAGKLHLGAAPDDWFAGVLRKYDLRTVPLTERVAFAAYSLPEPFHRDPGDRLVVAFGRLTGWPVVTSDRKIIDYARAEHVGVVAY